MNIFEISQDLQDIYNELEENGGELTPELEEKLTISEADFKSKVKSYTDVIKCVESDIKLIDEEVDRLKTLKESKKKTIARLEKVIIWAIDKFGETNKSGNKFVDFGTGKVNVRISDKVEVNDEYADNTVNNFITTITEYARTKEIFYNDVEELIPIQNEEDLKGVNVDISFNVPILDLYKEDKFDIIKTFFEHNTMFKAKANVSKSELKEELKENPNSYPNLAKIVKNKTITIK